MLPSNYSFNNQEHDDEMYGDGNAISFDARVLDPRLGRWLSVDPKVGKYPQWSPYHFGYDNPIVTIDEDGEENVIVVAAENHSETPGNKLMFMLHAIRAARKYQKLSGESTTVLLFNHGYSDKQVKAFERVCKMFGVSNVVKVSNVDEVVNYINSKNTKTASLSTERQSDPVSNLDIFSHGLPGRIPLDYEGGKSNTDLTIEKVNQIDPKSFGKDPATGETPLFVSYACRTGTPDEEGNNLAQSFADRTGATVKAFKRRSNYDDTFSNKDIRNFNRTMKLNKLIPGYGTLLYMNNHGLDKYYQIDAVNKALEDKKKRYTIDGALFDERGAFKEPRSGDTPEELPEGQFEFKPQAKEN